MNNVFVKDEGVPGMLLESLCVLSNATEVEAKSFKSSFREELSILSDIVFRTDMAERTHYIR